MARPQKTGLCYFPFDVDFFNDEKIEAISGEFGIKGEILAIRLLALIYKNGYYIEFTDLVQAKLLKAVPSITKELLLNIVQRLIKYHFFDPQSFEKHNVLTSKGIQKRYLEATKRNVVSGHTLPFILVSVTKKPVSVTKTPVSVTETPIKENKSINNITSNIINTHGEHFSKKSNITKNEALKTNLNKKASPPAPPPSLEQFLSYAQENITKNNLGEFSDFKFALTAKYEQWAADNWNDGYNKPIKNWKTKLLNTLPYLKKMPYEPPANNPSPYANASTTHQGGSAQASNGKISAHSLLAQKYATEITSHNTQGFGAAFFEE